jgi:hypothetical protein
LSRRSVVTHVCFCGTAIGFLLVTENEPNA